MSSTTTILITGANRGQKANHRFPVPPSTTATNVVVLGIGHALLATYLARPRTTVIAGVRDPNHATSRELLSLPKGSSSRLIVVKIDSASETDAAAAVRQLQSTHNITNLELVIANAGIAQRHSTVADTKPAEFLEHVAVNVGGPVLLFQAVLPLLHKGSKFVTMSSSAGSIGGIELRPVPNAPYGASKAALNYITRKAHFEHEDLIIFPIDPG